MKNIKYILLGKSLSEVQRDCTEIPLKIMNGVKNAPSAATQV